MSFVSLSNLACRGQDLNGTTLPNQGDMFHMGASEVTTQKGTGGDSVNPQRKLGDHLCLSVSPVVETADMFVLCVHVL